MKDGAYLLDGLKIFVLIWVEKVKRGRIIGVLVRECKIYGYSKTYFTTAKHIV